MLLEEPGEIVTRDQFRTRLWPADTFVDFEHGLNTAVRKLRATLGDSPESPRYIETLPRVGYRFIAPVEAIGDQTSGQTVARVQSLTASPLVIRPGSQSELKPRRHAIIWIARSALAAVVVAAMIVALNVAGTRDRIWAFVWRDSVRGVGGSDKAQRSIAVLPLENLSGDREQDYFAEGMTDELTTDLAQTEGLRVISRTSAMHYKGTNKTAPQIGRELGVDALIEGTVERVGDRVRIRTQLIDCATDRHLWGKIYNRELKDSLALESEAAREIAEQIQGNVISAQLSSHSVSARPVNAEAYEAFLKGRYFWNKRTEEGFRNSVEYFQAAISKDPTYAQAYAGLADSYLLLGGYGFEDQKDVMPRAKAAALKALAIDDRLADAYTSLGLIAEQYEWNWAEAEQDFRSAIELNPNYSVAHHWYGDGYLAAVGKTDEAIAELRKAHELDPLSLVIATDLAKRLCFAGNYDEGIEQFRRILEIDPNYVLAHYYLSQAYELKGAYPEAIAEAKKIKPPDDIPYEMGQLGHIYALVGRRHEALEIVHQLERISKQKHINPYYISNIYIALGEKDLVFLWLERAYQQHSSTMTGLKTDPVYSDAIRSDPRFNDLMRRVGLAASSNGGTSSNR